MLLDMFELLPAAVADLLPLEGVAGPLLVSLPVHRAPGSRERGEEVLIH